MMNLVLGSRVSYYSFPDDHGGMSILFLSFQLLGEGRHLLSALTP